MMAERHYYMVRAMFSRESDFDVFFKKSVVAVGWSDIDFSSYSESEALREAVRRRYFASSQTNTVVASKKMNEAVRFKGIQAGDYIVVPFYSSIALAVAETDEVYSHDEFDMDLANQRKVSYHYYQSKIYMIPRNELSEGLQRRLRVRGTTVANLFEFGDEIEKIFSHSSYSQEMQILKQKERGKLKQGLLDHIRNGKTNLQTGGIGLENLVCELMRCEGYDAEVLAKSKFTGRADADIQAFKEDDFMSKKIFVQVKHHSGFSGKAGIQQVIDVLNQEEYREYDGYFVTSADVDDQTKRFAADHGIEVMDGEALVGLIIDNWTKLSEKTICCLGISPYPHLLL